MNQTSPKVIVIVIVSISVLAFLGVSSICASLFLHTYADPAILTALISITSGLVGSLTTILSSPRSMGPAGDVTQTSTITTTTKPTAPATSNDPQPVTISQPANEPVPVMVSPTPINNPEAVKEP